MISLLGVNVQHQRSRHEVRNTIRLAVVDVLATLPWSESSMPSWIVDVLAHGGWGAWGCRAGDWGVSARCHWCGLRSARSAGWSFGLAAWQSARRSRRRRRRPAGGTASWAGARTFQRYRGAGLCPFPSRPRRRQSSGGCVAEFSELAESARESAERRAWRVERQQTGESATAHIARRQRGAAFRAALMPRTSHRPGHAAQVSSSRRETGQSGAPVGGGVQTRARSWRPAGPRGPSKDPAAPTATRARL